MDAFFFFFFLVSLSTSLCSYYGAQHEMKEFIISSITHQKAWNTVWTYAKDLLRKSCPEERIGQRKAP